jgi:hypothetical protein
MLRRNFTELLFSLPFLGFNKKEDSIENTLNKILNKQQLVYHKSIYNFSEYGNTTIRVFTKINKSKLLEVWFVGNKSGIIPTYYIFPKCDNQNFNNDALYMAKLIKQNNKNTKILVRLIKDSSTKIQDDFIEV